MARTDKKGYRLLNACLFFILIAVTATLSQLYRQRDMPDGDSPNIVARTTTGTKINLTELSRDKPALLYFWSSWCRVCGWVGPSVSKISKGHPVVTVAVLSGSSHRINQFLQASNLGFPVVNDSDGALSRQWGVRTTPSLVIVRDGNIHSITTGYTSQSGIEARLWLAKRHPVFE